MRILCAGMFPALQRTLELDALRAGSVNRVRRVTESVGGKAVNTARVVKALGGNPRVFGFAGGDNAVTIRRLLDAERISHHFVKTRAPVRLCHTLLTPDIPDFTELVENGPVLDPGDWQRFQAAFEQRVREDSPVAVVISGTRPPHAPVTVYADMIEGMDGMRPVVLDTPGEALMSALARGSVLVKINAAELRSTAGIPPDAADSEAILDTAARGLLDAGAMAVGVTRGPEPALLWTRSKPFRRFPIPRLRVASSLGSGDAVSAGIALALAQGRDPETAFALGLACGASNAAHPLPGMISPADVETMAVGILSDAV